MINESQSHENSKNFHYIYLTPCFPRVNEEVILKKIKSKEHNVLLNLTKKNLLLNKLPSIRDSVNNKLNLY